MAKELKTGAAYPGLVERIGELLELGRQRAGRAVNTILVQTYWEIGRHIVEFEQGGNEVAAYGSDLLNRLAQDLTIAYGKGFGRSNLFYMRKLYVSFQNRGTLSHDLTWSHYYEILKADSELEVSFYVKQCELESWSVRELKRQMKSMLFHRLALSKDKKGVAMPFRSRNVIQHSQKSRHCLNNSSMVYSPRN